MELPLIIPGESGLIPRSSHFGGIVCKSRYDYAQLGIVLFGGRIYPENPVLAESKFAEAGYFNVNFNDFPGSMVYQKHTITNQLN